MSIAIFIQSNHFGLMQFNLIFQTYSNNPKKHSIQTHVSQFNVIRVNIYSIQSRKYLFNPIEDIYSIQSRKYLFNPITEIFIQSVKYSFNPITEIFIQSNHKNTYSISHSYSIHPKTYSMQSSRNSFNLPGASAVSIKHGLRTYGLRTTDWV